MIEFEHKIEHLDENIKICTTKEHSFGTDAILLASFAKIKKNYKVCDLGTGCGIIPLYWCKNAPPKIIYGIDIQSKAISQLKYSLELSKIKPDFHAICADLKSLPKNIPIGELDVVSCNPPYKPKGTGILSENSSDKISRHETECTLKDICTTSQKLLKYGGKLILCSRPERLCDVIEAMKFAKIEPKRLQFVSQKKGKQPWLFLIEGRQSGNPFLIVEPELVLEDESGYTRKYREIYN